MMIRIRSVNRKERKVRKTVSEFVGATPVVALSIRFQLRRMIFPANSNYQV